MMGPVLRIYRLMDVLTDGTVTVLTETAEIKSSVPVLDTASLLKDITNSFKESKGSVRVVVVPGSNASDELVVDFKVDPVTQLEIPQTPGGGQDEQDNIIVDVYRFSHSPQLMPAEPAHVDPNEVQNVPPEVVYSFPPDATVYHVHQSVSRGRLEASLKITTQPTGDILPVFRWIHMERPMMKFSELKLIATTLPDLTERERKALKVLLERVENEFEESHPGTATRSMKPGHLTETFLPQTTGYGTVSWLSIPYFCRASLSNAPSIQAELFPMSTLLQYHGLSPTTAREMEQVISRTQENPSQCLHVPQMWSVEVNGSLLITYGNVKLSDPSDFSDIKVTTLPQPQIPQPPADCPRKILVSYGRDTMWSLPFEKCETWPSFLSHFTEFYPERIVFTHEGNYVGVEEFAELTTQEGNRNIRMTLNISEGYEGFVAEGEDGFTVFEWFTDTELPNEADQQTKIEDRLAVIESFLQDQAYDSRHYARAPSCSSASLQALVQETDASASRVDLKSEEPEEGNIAQTISDHLINLALKIEPFKLLFSRNGLIKPATDKSSHPLEQAWLHLLMSLIYVRPKPSRCQQHMAICLGLFEMGLKKIDDSIDRQAIQKEKVALPLDILTIMGWHLLDHKSSGMDIKQILEIYSAYFYTLKTRVQLDPLERSHREDIRFLQDEIKMIQDVLADQKAVFDKLAVSQTDMKKLHQLERQQDKTQGNLPEAKNVKEMNGGDIDGLDSQLPHSQSSISGAIARDCMDLIDHTAKQFNHLELQVSNLKEMNVEKIESDKDRQESAIYAFTIVTIIFLPLNTVSSIFGMNTVDIRNIEDGQWIYWAVAIPLTAAVMALTLFWVGELDNVYKTLRDLITRRGRLVQRPWAGRGR
ncbi:Nucleic acid-bindingOB-fold [Penicillium lividum]|nr:Nucleic acid-bindingOB-fold [Penicillium lividum]